MDLFGDLWFCGLESQSSLSNKVHQGIVIWQVRGITCVRFPLEGMLQRTLIGNALSGTSLRLR